MFELFDVDKLTLIKKDGKRFDNIACHVIPEKSKIITRNVSIPVEEGDKLFRILPSGLEEYYIILDPGYHSKFNVIPASYNMKVRKETKQNIQEPVSMNYNITVSGNNSKVNFHSTDNSINIQIDKNNVFEELKKTIDKEISNLDEKVKLLNNVEKLESTKDTKGFAEAYNEFIASAANHITIIAPFIPILMSFIGAS